MIQALFWSTERFVAYGPSHLMVLAAMLAGSLALVSLGRRAPTHAVHRILPRVLGLVIVTSEIVFVAYPIPLGYFSPVWGLPLQLCDLTALTFGTALVCDWRFGLELGYFLGLSGTLLTTLTPDLAHDAPHIEFFCFFLTHALVSVVALYSTFGLDRRPRPGAAPRVWLAVNLYGLAAGALNHHLHSNYLYICRKPPVASPFDYMGPWPVYVVVLDLVLAALLLLLTALSDRIPVTRTAGAATNG